MPGEADQLAAMMQAVLSMLRTAPDDELNAFGDFLATELLPAVQEERARRG